MQGNHWNEDRKACCRAIAGTPAPFKILLKTKDDPFLLERWISHHRRIVGPDNIIIFDNMSTNPAVLDLYEKYRDTVLVIRFPGRHNSLHYVSEYADLYDALKASARFFICLDTDEFLIFVDGDRWRDDATLVDFLRDQGQSDVLPATWLPNTDWSAARFRCGQDFDTFAKAVAWGKPILRAKASLAGFIHHNMQLDQALFSKPFRTNFLILHLKNLIPEQRISSNVNKLIDTGFAAPGDSAETIARRSLEGITGRSTIRYVTEIRNLLSLAVHPEPDGPLGAGCLELTDGHAIRYHGKKERALVHALINDPVATYLKARLRTKFLMQKKGQLPGLVPSDRPL